MAHENRPTQSFILLSTTEKFTNSIAPLKVSEDCRGDELMWHNNAFLFRCLHSVLIYPSRVYSSESEESQVV